MQSKPETPLQNLITKYGHKEAKRQSGLSHTTFSRKLRKERKIVQQFEQSMQTDQPIEHQPTDVDLAVVEPIDLVLQNTTESLDVVLDDDVAEPESIEPDLTAELEKRINGLESQIDFLNEDCEEYRREIDQLETENRAYQQVLAASMSIEDFGRAFIRGLATRRGYETYGAEPVFDRMMLNLHRDPRLDNGIPPYDLCPSSLYDSYR
ncbi:hypothetical protein ACSI5I_001572 [Vibrio vulnificus]|nr:hypothetical protein [Vibrio vulnificus]